jgi:hypothetical protein
VVGFIEDFYQKDRLFIVMEFVPCNLLEVLESHNGGLGREMIRSVMFQVRFPRDPRHAWHILSPLAVSQ